jgi:hypothetical protein
MTGGYESKPLRIDNPQFQGGNPTMFICGNDEAAKETVRGILDQFGWETADMGKAEAARAIEPLCMLWLIPGFLRNEWTHAFKLLHRGSIPPGELRSVVGSPGRGPSYKFEETCPPTAISFVIR